MSEGNAEAVRRVFDYFNETGEAGPLELYDAEVTFTTRGDVGGPETFSGHRGMAAAVASFAQAWAKTAAHIIELIARTVCAACGEPVGTGELVVKGGTHPVKGEPW